MNFWKALRWISALLFVAMVLLSYAADLATDSGNDPVLQQEIASLVHKIDRALGTVAETASE